MSPDHRPVYIDLRKINLPISAWISITHRITGIINIIAITFICLFASLVVFGESNYELINLFFSS